MKGARFAMRDISPSAEQVMVQNLNYARIPDDAISAPCDLQHQYVAPEYRLGT
jgi:hypothetical protein